MNSNAPTSRAPTITARPTADEKRQFVELAARSGVSESELALRAIRMMLSFNSPPTVSCRPLNGTRWRQIGSPYGSDLVIGRHLICERTPEVLWPRGTSPPWFAPTSPPARP